MSMFTRKPNESSGAEPSYGYLTAIHFADHGYFGGYLIVSSLGRPLEFHCTAPVRPSRAQEILYGPTLHAYLLGEQVSRVLVEAAKLTPDLIVTDDAAIMNVRSQVGMPLVLVMGPAEQVARSESGCGTSPEIAVAGRAALVGQTVPNPSGQVFVASNHELQLPGGYAADQPLVVRLLDILTRHIELAEPFDRIHQAIREAQRIGTRSHDCHGEAA